MRDRSGRANSKRCRASASDHDSRKLNNLTCKSKTQCKIYRRCAGGAWRAAHKTLQCMFKTPATGAPSTASERAHGIRSLPRGRASQASVGPKPTLHLIVARDQQCGQATSVLVVSPLLRHRAAPARHGCHLRRAVAGMALKGLPELRLQVGTPPALQVRVQKDVRGTLARNSIPLL